MSVGRIFPLLLALVSWPAMGESSGPPARNVILISLDSLRADHLPAYGYPRETMPRLDARMAQRGAIVFSRMTAVTSSCHPSHTAVLTGLHPQEVGVPGCGEDLLDAPIDELEEYQEEMREQPPALRRKKLSAVMNWLSIPADSETLATYLHDRGFRTGGFASLWTVHRRFGYARGFDLWVDRMPEYYGPAGLSWLLRDTMRMQRRQVGEATLDAALTFLDGLDREERFFVFLHLADTHVPYAPRSAPAFQESTEERAALEKVWSSRYADATRERAMARMSRGQEGFLLDRYDGAIRYVDAQLGRLFDWLDARGRADETLIVITSDHGDSFGQHFYLSAHLADRLFFEHSVQVWEETQAVPLILLGPGVGRDVARRAGNVSHVDLVPTIVQRLGLDVADFGTGMLPGRSLFEPEPDARTVYFLTFGRGRPGLLRHFELDYPKFIGFRRLDFKFFVDRERFKNPDAGRCFAYDLASDPNEMRNLCGVTIDGPTAERYRSQLTRWYGVAAEARREGN